MHMHMYALAQTCSIYTRTYPLMHTHTPQLADGVWLVEGDEARLVAFFGTYITGEDGKEGCDVNERSYGRRGREPKASINRTQRAMNVVTRHMSKS